MNNLLQDPDYWRARAEKIRVKAEQSSQDDSKHELLRVAEAYERIARIAEERQTAGKD
jgi:hypothetical protein